jgi:hypothetical protein
MERQLILLFLKTRIVPLRGATPEKPSFLQELHLYEVQIQYPEIETLLGKLWIVVRPSGVNSKKEHFNEWQNCLVY